MAFCALIFTSCDSDDDNNNLPDNSRAELYATSVSNGDITVYNFANNAEVTTLTTASTSNEGIQYDASSDELYVASRSSLRLNSYVNVESFLTGGLSAVVGVNGSVDFNSPRALAVSGNSIVVADNGTNAFYVYTRTASGLSLRNQFDVNFAVWGVEFIGNDLYAVVDQTGDLAIFNNFLSNTTSGTLTASKRITIEGIVRTHGIAYDATDDVLIMTDIGAASGAGSDTDGGFHIINNATSNIAAVADGGTLAIAGIQTRVAGAATLMGNPIDVTYDTSTNTVIIAEIANGGGRVLGFNNVGSGGNISPSINNTLAGASSVDFYLRN
ncbi:secreted protein [Nonlabens dokdonensis DSW-6]|uniref:Secreted protein n=2 Tax=Nonlabens dokdonensis TaxID=328515 RepID=L7W6R7_NONDD|nr:secreted protein [Nonlabens dokdonensis DSW-6]